MPRPKKQTTSKKLQVSKTGSSQQDITETYRHPTAESLMRPEVGTQAQFRKKKPPVTYRYDSSLDPSMSWDEGNEAREQGEKLIREILEAETIEAAKAAATKLRSMSQPFLSWCGKAEQPEFEVP